MKTLIINGSPRKNGCTAALVGELKALLDGDVRIVETYYARIAPCNDCRYCWVNDKCIIDDPMQDLYQYINEADNIVIASPIYFAEVTGSLLQWASRLQYFWTAKNFRKQAVLAPKERKGAVILVDGGEGIMAGALAMGKRLLRTMGAKYCGHVYFSGTDSRGPSLPAAGDQVIDEISKLAQLLNHKA